MASANFLTSFAILMMCFISTVYNTASPATSDGFEEPTVYFTFNRWENRTFSPRVYYLLLQRYGLRNRLMDLNSEYHQYLGEKGVIDPRTPQDDSVKIIFRPIPRRRIQKVTTSDIIDRTALASIHPKKAFLDLRIKEHLPSQVLDMNQQFFNPSPVVFPTSSSPRKVPPKRPNNELFAGRIAYPGLSNRRIIQSSSPAAHKLKLASAPPEELTTFVFDTTQSLPTSLTDEDIVDTVELTVGIIKHSHWDDENAVVSPFSITNVLALLFLGSDGKTFNELAQRLKPGNPFTFEEQQRETKFHKAFLNLVNYLHAGYSGGVAIDVCNRILADKKYPVMDSYRKKAIEFYDAHTNILDFEKQGEEVMKTVNQWVAYKTKGKIPSIINAPPSPDTTLALVNAVYFKGSWETPFIREITQRKPFYVTETETIDVSMMTNILTVPYIETDIYKAIGIPYSGRGVGMFVLLPKNPGIKGLKEMESQISSELLKKMNTMKPTQVTIQIPKMRIEGDGQLTNVLSELGLNSMFNPKTANFTRMSDTPGLHVSSVLHKAIFEMNEAGATASAATVATGDRTLDDRPTLFAVNRPFAFIIYNVKAKTILFFGRVTRPLPFVETSQ